MQERWAAIKRTAKSIQLEETKDRWSGGCRKPPQQKSLSFFQFLDLSQFIDPEPIGGERRLVSRRKGSETSQKVCHNDLPNSSPKRPMAIYSGIGTLGKEGHLDISRTVRYKVWVEINTQRIEASSCTTFKCGSIWGLSIKWSPFNLPVWLLQKHMEDEYVWTTTNSTK